MSEKQDVAKSDVAQQTQAVLPPVDIVEDEAGIRLTADLPGVPKDQLSVRTEGQSLLIEGQVAIDTPEGMEPVYVETRSPVYRRTFNLSRDLDPTKIEAAFRDGVLTLRIPKAEHAQPRKIAVSVV
ncbi:Hsp20/alpha crystallin family protein [Methylotetracoccus oryzae]|uniref:Hsp20/alpha crystallin family protein n=1 Tax=Methylotetracoccus oryzae TaxID=1919059 RepID=UPI00111BC452|nr:Hsp20/alpha crystallin family protein [Methylotetracoccus oryzae]